MLEQVVSQLNNVKAGDKISLTLPIGNDTLAVTGTATIDSNGNIVIKADSITSGSVSITNGTLTIERENGVLNSKDINIHIDGTCKDEKINDFNINIKDGEVTLSGAPTGIKEGTFDINDSKLKVTIGETGNYGSGSTYSLGNNQNIYKPAGGDGGNGNNTGSSSNTDGSKTQNTGTDTNANGTNNGNEKDISSKFVAKTHDDYWNSEFQSILDNTSGVNYDTLAKQLQQDVDYLQKDYSKVKDQINVWKGSASDTAKEALNSILDKFGCTMDNINNAVGPACEKIEEFKEQLEKLKTGKEELTGEDGNGGLDKELKDLTKDYEDKKAAYEALKAAYDGMSDTTTNKVADGTNEDGTTKYKTVTVENEEKKKKKTELDAAETAMKEAEKKKTEMENTIKAKEAELDVLLEDIKTTYSMIKEFTSTVSTFKDYIGKGLSNGTFSSADKFTSNYDQLLSDLNISLASDADYGTSSTPVLADTNFFAKACKEHASEGWSIQNGVVTMVLDGKKCTYDMNKHTFTSNGKTLQTYFYLPSHVVQSNDYSQLENLNTYTFFSTSQSQYVNTIQNRKINCVSMMVIKKDPMGENYDTVRSITKMANQAANTNLTKCKNIIGGDSVYGAHSLKIAASSGDLYDTVYCVDNAAIVTGYNGKARTKEQFSSIDELKGLDGKNIYFINTSGDDNYATGADMSVQNGRAYVQLGSRGNVSTEDVKHSFTYTGIELVAKTCPNAKVHIVYQDQDTSKGYQKTNFPKALNELDSRYSNIWNDSSKWDLFANKKYKTHSEGNYIPHDLASAASTTNPNYDNAYKA